MQTCSKCKEEKEYAEYYKAKRSKSGYRYDCKVCYNQVRKVYYNKNKESLLKKSSEYQKNNLHIFRKANKKWRDNNKEKMAELVKNWSDNNKDKRRYGYSKRRALKANATPEWADMKKIQEVFSGAKRLEDLTGMKYHVDHIIPLNHPDVCGLHVWVNLQVLEASLNIKKGNKL